MQVVVRSLPTDTDVPVLSVYDDDRTLDMTTQPQGAFCVRGLSSKYITGSIPITLSKDWRNDYTSVVNAEAAIRINDVFPASMQSSAALVRQSLIMSDGPDPSSWPQSDQDRNAEIQRGIDFITTVNAAAASIITNAPNNPCDPALWPTPIAPIQL